jgi:hypothetical protein
VFVLPAFETAPQRNQTKAHHLADAASGMPKAELVGLVQKRLVYQFAVFLFWQVGGVRWVERSRRERRVCVWIEWGGTGPAPVC